MGVAVGTGTVGHHTSAAVVLVLFVLLVIVTMTFVW
ncbi:YjcZ family sporulation protein [Paenibacillus roseipurpureus]|uniref:YjcZ family sporulation protein n=1 Tax=Paenibacillus roseopurpureus TaxID=2918901 RepID=A0AA96LQU6_9BACL|nr:YjcZ family sporulation protein [Paenibacillus sp. MBLB1832]WNR45509.1 YjcZ family sporulation protein [Paenibacillus sp. MBLB1832]